MIFVRGKDTFSFTGTTIGKRHFDRVGHGLRLSRRPDSNSRDNLENPFPISVFTHRVTPANLHVRSQIAPGSFGQFLFCIEQR